MKSVLAKLSKTRRYLSRASSAATLLAGAGMTAMLCIAHPRMAVAQESATTFYNGGDPKSVGLTLNSWGSGSIMVDPKYSYSGAGSLKIVTHGLYQGASVEFSKPVDFGAFAANKAAYLQLALIPPPPSTTTGQGGTSGPLPPPGPGMPGSGGIGAGNRFGGVLGGARDPGATATKFQKAHPLETLRLVLVTSGGKSLEVRAPLSYATDENAWKLLSIPIAAIPGLKADDAQIKEIRVFGDEPGTLYVGKIGIVMDSNKITVDAMDEKIVTANQKYRYTATAHGGISPLLYSWDWDDRDGIQDESQGRSASHLYRKPGDYKVTVTVSDPFGVKEPASTKFNIHIP